MPTPSRTREEILRAALEIIRKGNCEEPTTLIAARALAATDPEAEAMKTAMEAAHELCGVRGDGWCLWTSDVVHSSHCDAVTAAIEQARDEALDAVDAALNEHAERWPPWDSAHVAIGSLRGAIAALRGRVAESARKEGT